VSTDHGGYGDGGIKVSRVYNNKTTGVIRFYSEDGTTFFTTEGFRGARLPYVPNGLAGRSLGEGE